MEVAGAQSARTGRWFSTVLAAFVLLGGGTAAQAQSYGTPATSSASTGGSKGFSLSSSSGTPSAGSVSTGGFGSAVGGGGAGASFGLGGGVSTGGSASFASPAGGGVSSGLSVGGAGGASLQLAFPNRPTLKAPDFFGGAASTAAKAGDAGGRAAAAASTARSGADILRTRMQVVLDDLVGVPYRYGGREPADGLDSAGLVWHVYRQLHRPVPDDPDDQQRMGTRLGADQFVDRNRFRDDARLRPGDVLFFRVGLRQAGTTGMRPVVYYGGGKAVYPSQSRGHVVVEDIRDKARALAFVQRVLLP